MKRIRNVIVLAALVLVMFQCQTKSSANQEEGPVETTQSLFTETMEIHDVAMAKMGKSNQLTRTLRDMIDSLQQSESSDSALVAQYEQLKTQLEEADENMMQWMSDFKIDQKDDETAESKAYYKAEKAKIDEINKAMDKAISAAQDALSN